MELLPNQPSTFLVSAFIILPLLMISGLAFIAKSWKFTLYLGLWVLCTGIFAYSGRLTDFSTLPPPGFALLIIAIFAAISLPFSKAGAFLSKQPLQLIVGFQSFRIIVEIAIHLAVLEGVAPPQMSWSGLNYDIFAGISALLIFPLAQRITKWSLILLNTVALCSLLWTLFVAVCSLPIPIQQFTPAGIWVTVFPFNWLPSILVPIALLGHIALFRKLAKF
ncbi:MAG: hypothetical protein KZQ99_07900 [Candidatus Thiodiazotropha sp. (ex Dulcina madagascariensis)]|nr:hypothetical protein [Candidatus Thiodiazotropha sp. (ex Dulcina madagascariensis)]